MIRKYNIVKILKAVISEMIIIVKVDSFTDNSDGTFNITSCNPQYLNSCSYFTVDGNDYFVQEFDGEESLKIKGTPALDNDFVIPPPLFIADTPMGANNNLIGKVADISRLPFIWLLEDFPTNYDLSSSVSVQSRVRLFFMNTNKESEWLEGTHRSECIEPMTNLCNELLINIKKKVSGKLDKFTIKNRIRFGRYQDNKGHDQKIIDENLSGVELDLEVPIKKWAVGCDKC